MMPLLYFSRHTNYQKLRHAIMALSALSISVHEGSRNIYALQHYEQALAPLQGLKREEDLASDGALLTHFILLIYEVGSLPVLDSYPDLVQR